MKRGEERPVARWRRQEFGENEICSVTEQAIFGQEEATYVNFLGRIIFQFITIQIIVQKQLRFFFAFQKFISAKKSISCTNLRFYFIYNENKTRPNITLT